MRLLFPVHAAEGLPFILEILFLFLLCVSPPFLFLVPCRKRGSIQSIPFFYSAVPAESRLHALDDRDKKRRGYEAKRGLNLPGFIFLPSLSPLLALSHTLEHRWGTSEWQRCMFCSVALHLFFLLLSLPPFGITTSLRARLCFSLARWLTQELCQELALRVQRHLWMCLCWGTKVAS